ncbi:uncharacterized protein A4U43_C08F23950 [Asparagus officinalis]|nr:uncharacterized protein A4U43_C08F23950 [Asparagus officinalis]
MTPRRTISRGIGSVRGARQPSAEEALTLLEITVGIWQLGLPFKLPIRRAPVDRHNHFGHDGTHDPEVSHVFDENVPLFLEGSSQDRIKTIRTSIYRTLWEIIIDTKFSAPHEDVSVKPHFLFRDSVHGGNSLFHWREEY